MSNVIATFKSETGDELSQDYEVQTALNDAINAAMDHDGEASRSIWVQSSHQIFEVTHIEVTGDADDCEITIHIKPL